MLQQDINILATGIQEGTTCPTGRNCLEDLDGYELVDNRYRRPPRHVKSRRYGMHENTTSLRRWTSSCAGAVVSLEESKERA